MLFVAVKCVHVALSPNSDHPCDTITAVELHFGITIIIITRTDGEPGEVLNKIYMYVPKVLLHDHPHTVLKGPFHRHHLCSKKPVTNGILHCIEFQ